MICKIKSSYTTNLNANISRRNYSMAEEKKIEAPAKVAEVKVEAKKPAAKKATAKKPATKKTAAKKPAAKKAPAARKSTAKKAAPAKKAAAKKTPAKATTKAPAKKVAAKKPAAKKVKKLGKIILEIEGQQIDFKKIEKKAAKLGGDVYIVAGEKKIFDAEGKSVDLF